MVGSPGIAAWIAHLAFWILIVWGLVTSELDLKRVLLFLALWCVGLFGLPFLPYGSALFSSYVAMLDVALVLVIWKGDVPIT